MLKDILASGAEMLESAGFKNVEANDTMQPPGLGIHEMGTARMGRNPKTSVLNAHNQVWGCEKCFRDGWCLYDLKCLPKPVVDLHGFNRPCG